ncbi:pectin lyase-like protein [Dentipellis sp. KUC8613]|nr:pectin lyase-like protein [Dentipellis sp. KUC8613]
MKNSVVSFLSLLLIQPAWAWPGTVRKHGNICTVIPSPDGGDDSPAIVSAFHQCSRDASVVFLNKTYHIERVMETTNLHNVTVDLKGTLLWGTDLPYWRNHSVPLGYQNQTVAWIVSGSGIKWNGHGYGTFNGNGQPWYELSHGVSDVHGRPINLVLRNTTDSVFEGLRFVQSQFWTMAIQYSRNIVLDNIYINSTSENNASTINTDGLDTFYSDNITIRNWSVTNGDDQISLKANTSNVLIQNATFYRGNGIAIGSIGQYLGQYEFVANVTAQNVTCIGSQYAAYVKTWTGIQQGYPPNGGGGGTGYVNNLTFSDFTVSNLTQSVAAISQCTSYIGATGQCDSSHFQISNVSWGPVRGSVANEYVAQFQCSGAVPCPGIALTGIDVTTNASTPVYNCSNLVQPSGFNCTSGS